MSMTEELKELKDLYDAGSLTEEEYQHAKQLVIEKSSQSNAHVDDLLDRVDERQWAMLLHLSQLLGYLVPLAGFAAPIIIWQIKKDESSLIDEQGKIVTNWILTSVIYCVLFIVLALFLVGIPLLILLSIACVVYPIIGAVKGYSGKTWKYPLSFAFLVRLLDLSRRGLRNSTSNEPLLMTFRRKSINAV